ncbi:AAA family ATPase [Undibacterium sp. RuTC16W]|uniref:AAA family ATPase n=1 Tax=Undibacterium sp. RuTC16W TaxID=3413048 RepID=UPI003BF01482
MYRSHFGLNQAPFSITPNPVFFYSGSQRGDILEALVYAVKHGEGIIKVTGEVGSGKTMLCRMLESRMPANVEVIFMVNPTLRREDVMFMIAGELGIPVNGRRGDEVLRQLHHDLIAKHIAGKQVVLLIEEAQAMSLDTLEEIRLFSNLETAHHKLLQIVLFGQPELDVSLNLPRMRQLKERITHSFTMPPLTTAVIPDFLMFRMRAAGYHGPDIFSKKAIQLLGSVSEGIVRRINILADKALLAAFADNTHLIELAHMKAAIRDSEFIGMSQFAFKKKIILVTISGLVLVLVSMLAWGLYQRQNRAPAVAVTPALVKSIASLPTPGAVTATAIPENSSSITDTKPATEVLAKPLAIAATPVASPLSMEASQAAPQTEQAPPTRQSASKTGKPLLLSDIVSQRLTASKTWLASAAGDDYTIQLALIDAHNQSKLEQFLKKASAEIGIDDLFLYPTTINAKPCFGVVYANFKTREAAQLRLGGLEAKRTYRGQLRTVGGLRAEIFRSHSENVWVK